MPATTAGVGRRKPNGTAVYASPVTGRSRLQFDGGSRTPLVLSTGDIQRLIRAAGRTPIERDSVDRGVAGSSAPSAVAAAVRTPFAEGTAAH
jgi:hypothetical protein